MFKAYDKQTQKEAVELAERVGVKVAAEKTKISMVTIYKWLRRRKVATKDQSAEIERLRDEIKRQQDVIAALQQATALVTRLSYRKA